MKHIISQSPGLSNSHWPPKHNCECLFHPQFIVHFLSLFLLLHMIVKPKVNQVIACTTVNFIMPGMLQIFEYLNGKTRDTILACILI